MSSASPMTGAGVVPVATLALANGLGISSAVISVTMSALVARQLGWTGALATVPYGMQFLTLLLATYPSARLMARFGRKPVFLGAALSGGAGGLVGYLALILGDPLLLCVAHGLLGISLANQNFYRFAALEVASPERKATAMSLVVFGGTFAAIAGPLLSRHPLFSPEVFQSAYLGITVLWGVIMVLILSTRLPRPQTVPAKFGLHDVGLALRQPRLVIGMAFAAIGYGAMNLLMIASGLTMDGLGCSYTQVSVAIQWHVLAMFLPSLVMGRVIARFGGLSVAATGGLLLIGSSIGAYLQPWHVPTIEFTLILLGIGWNMTYVGGSYLVARAAPPEHGLSIQAMNDVAIGIFAMLGAFLPGLILGWFGWAGANLLVIALILPIVGFTLVHMLATSGQVAAERG
ncbi:MAG: MFS transporter [Salinarimonas sp.]|nr:MFS transporter [Salinarimonas sp.]